MHGSAAFIIDTPGARPRDLGSINGAAGGDRRNSCCFLGASSDRPETAPSGMLVRDRDPKPLLPSFVERRRESRIPIDEFVRVTLLTDPPSNPMIGRALDLSGRGLSLLLAQSLPRGVPVRIDQHDRLLLGEVIYCRAESGAFRIGIEVDQALRQTSDLQALRRAIQVPNSEGRRNADVTMEVTTPAWIQNH